MCDSFKSQLKSDAFIGSKYEGLCHHKKLCCNRILILITVHCKKLCVMICVSCIEVNSASCILSVLIEIL
jgi:hypothetical protein